MRNSIILVILVGLIIGAIFFLNFSKEESKTVTTSEGEEVVTGVSESGSKAEEGKEAPDFTLVDFEGKIVKLSDLKGKAVFIDFWAAWCPFCTDEMPDIEKLNNEFGDDLVVLGIHRTNTESVEVGRSFAQDEVGVTYNILQDKTDEVYAAYTPNFAGMPVAAWIDKDGTLVKKTTNPV
jgi:peroxiredoxin